jgi:UDPglucose 6-dehydrogenase
MAPEKSVGVGTAMNIVVLGLWHLGCVTAACCAEHFQVTGLDFDGALITNLCKGKPPLNEPGLDALIKDGLNAGRLRFTGDAPDACHDADVLWVCADTPIDENDNPNIDFVLNLIRRCAPALGEKCLVLISSQLPVGTCARLETEFPGRPFACSPENLRLGRALEIFRKPDRIVAGVRDKRAQAMLEKLFAPFSGNIIWMRSESAEMTKHAINAFLGQSIAFMNEIGRLCEITGADAREVERGLKTEARIGPRAYLHAGGAFSGGTLGRDIVSLTNMAKQKGEDLVLIPAITQSNDAHRMWAMRKLRRQLGSLNNKRIAILGLTYKAGTDTLRRSLAIELCRALIAGRASIQAFDPLVRNLPPDLAVTISRDAATALAGADAAIICTEWPAFKTLNWPALIRSMKQPVILDPNAFLAPELADNLPVQYFAVGLAK